MVSGIRIPRASTQESSDSTIKLSEEGRVNIEMKQILESSASTVHFITSRKLVSDIAPSEVYLFIFKWATRIGAQRTMHSLNYSQELRSNAHSSAHTICTNASWVSYSRIAICVKGIWIWDETSSKSGCESTLHGSGSRGSGTRSNARKTLRFDQVCRAFYLRWWLFNTQGKTPLGRFLNSMPPDHHTRNCTSKIWTKGICGVHL